MTPVLTDVRSAYKAGLTLLPAAEDGTKRPALPEWKTFQQQRPTSTDMRSWNFADRAGFGMVAGPVSGHAESWDFDDAPTFEAFLDAAAATGLAEVIQRIRNGYEDQTPNGGRRWIVRYPPDVTWADTVYARRPGRSGEKPVVTLVEMTLFAVLAPSNGSVHPSGKPYVRVSGSFATIARYTREERAAVIALARSFDQMPRREAAPARSVTGTRPGDDYNARATWREILTPHGWTELGARGPLTYWRRPEKTFGVSASTNQDTGLLWMFTSSTPFVPDVSYSKFGAFALLEHNGDYAAAAKALAARGYGQASSATAADSPTGGTRTARDTRQVTLTPATAFQIRPVRWMWDGRVQLGSLTLLAGREGIGKGLLMAHVVAQVTNGTLPGRLAGQPRAVLMAATEESWAHTIVPRLMAADADLSRVFRVEVVTPDLHLPVSLPQDLSGLEAAARDVSAALLVFDPLLSRLESGLDTHKDADTRRALEPLGAMADRLDLAIVGVIHVNKSQSQDALTLVMGSRAFAAVARSVLFVMADPDDHTRRLVGEPKNNDGRVDLPTLTFEVRGVCVATTDEGEVWTAQLEWGEPDDRTIHEALESQAEQRSDRDQMRDAETWLVDYLTNLDGPAAADTIIKAARGAGFGRTTVYRASAKLQLTHVYQGFPRTAYWGLSSQLSQTVGTTGTTETTGTTGTTGTTEPAEVQSSQLSQLSASHGDTDAGTTAAVAQLSPSARPSGTRTTGTTGTTEAEPSVDTDESDDGYTF